LLLFGSLFPTRAGHSSFLIVHVRRRELQWRDPRKLGRTTRTPKKPFNYFSMYFGEGRKDWIYYLQLPYSENYFLFQHADSEEKIHESYVTVWFSLVHCIPTVFSTAHERFLAFLTPLALLSALLSTSSKVIKSEIIAKGRLVGVKPGVSGWTDPRIFLFYEINQHTNLSSRLKLARRVVPGEQLHLFTPPQHLLFHTSNSFQIIASLEYAPRTIHR